MIASIFNLNRVLLCGIIMIIMLIMVSILGPFFAPYSEDHAERLRVVEVNGSKEYLYAPEKPSLRHLLGTNEDGFDILTILLHGAKYTLTACFMIAGLRILIGLVIGMSLGIKNKPTKKLEALGSVPAFVILVFLFYNFSFNSAIPIWQIFMVQIVSIAIIGLPGVIVPIQQQTYNVVTQPFIEAAKSIGAGKFRIIVIHIFPHIREKFLSVFVTEMIGALNLIGQMGILFIFIGGAIKTDDPPVFKSATNELAGLIGFVRNKVYSDIWMLFIFLSAYLLILFSFHMILQGVNRHYEKKYERYPHL